MNKERLLYERNFIETYRQYIQETRGFDRWCKAAFHFEPYLKTLTEANKRWVTQLNTLIRDMEHNLKGHTGSQGHPTEYDWFDFNR